MKKNTSDDILEPVVYPMIMDGKNKTVDFKGAKKHGVLFRYRNDFKAVDDISKIGLTIFGQLIFK